MAKSAAIKSAESPLSPEFGRKIRDARFSVGDNRFIVTFESGIQYSFPRSSLEVDDGSDLVNLQVDRRRSFFRVTQKSGNRYEIPWDRVLHEAEPSYAYFRGRMRRYKTIHEVGARVRKLREAKGFTQEQLAAAARMKRSNISRIEAAKHRPTLETLERIAKALNASVADLIAPR
jgi:DNA-binding XRE family transcriptional regulator